MGKILIIKGADFSSVAVDVNIALSIDISSSGNVTIVDKDAISIYYTTDGSTPTASSTLYTGTFSVVIGTTVKAVAKYSDGTFSSVVEKTYIDTETNLLGSYAISTNNFTSNIGASPMYESTNGGETTVLGSGYGRWGRSNAITIPQGVTKLTGKYAYYSSSALKLPSVVFLSSDDRVLSAVYPSNGVYIVNPGSFYSTEDIIIPSGSAKIVIQYFSSSQNTTARDQNVHWGY